MLKRNVKVAAFGLLLGATLVLPAALRAQEGPPPGAGGPGGGMPPMMRMGGHMGSSMKDPHPAVHRSERMLERVKFVLEKDTEADPGGHRAEALKSVEAAMEHLKAASDAMDKADKSAAPASK